MLTVIKPLLVLASSPNGDGTQSYDVTANPEPLRACKVSPPV